jgi:hypothetical protein
MKRILFKSIGTVLLPCLLSASTLFAAHYAPVQFPNHMTVIIPANLAPPPTVNGNPLIAGHDEVAVFAPGGTCAGSAVWPAAGTDLILTVYGDINYTSTSAMHIGDNLYFKIWDESATKEVAATVAFVAGKPDKYKNADTTTLSAFSAQVIPSKLTLTSPHGGEKWSLGSSHDITWKFTGTVTTVKIDLTLNNGATWTPLTGTPFANNNGVYTWKSPNTILGADLASAQCRIRVTPSNIAGDPGDFSDSAFTLAALINITAPKTDTVLSAGSPTNVVFSVNGVIGTVAVEYTLNNTTWTSITNSLSTTNPATISQPWTLPTAISKTCKVRVYKTYTGATWPVGNPADTSDNFIIAPPMTIKTPASAAHLVGATSSPIGWDALYSSGRVKLEYSINANANTPTWTVITASTVNTGTYAWTVPNTPSPHCKVRISDTLVSIPSATSAEFIIDPAPAIVVSSPNGGEAWSVGILHDITWSWAGAVGNVKIDYRTKPSAAWTTLIAGTANNGTYAWTIPATVSDSCMVRISDVANNTVLDTSNAIFSIKPPTMTVLSPNGAEKWATMTQHAITWKATGAVGNVKIELTTNDTLWSVIVASTPNDGTHPWTIPQNTPYSAKCRIRISQVEGGMPRDSGDALFEIVSGETPTITLTFPNGKETWFTGTAMPITWTSTGAFDSVALDYSLNGTDWRIIRTAAPRSPGAYTWSIPDTVSPSIHCRIRVTGIITGQPTDKSAENFTLAAPSIKVLTPNGGEAWNSKTVNTIGWSSDSIIGKVKIEYSANNGGAWVVLVDSAANQKGGSYAWNVPSVRTDSCKVRVSSCLRPAVSDLSDKVFYITPALSISIVAPTDQQKFRVGDTTTIVWTSYDVTGRVRIEYSTDNAATWALIRDSVDVAAGSYRWIAPNLKSDSCKIRIGSTSLAIVSDTSSGLFSIGTLLPPSITIANPVAQGTYFRSDSLIVLWTSYDLTGKVKIECSKNNGVDWIVVKDSVEIAVGRYCWNIPTSEVTSDSCKLRVSSSTVSATTSGIFAIKPTTSVVAAVRIPTTLRSDLRVSRAGFTFNISLPSAAPVRVRIFNLLGKEIAGISNGLIPAGYHQVSIPATRLQPGYYIAEISIGDKQFRRQVSYIR